MSATWRKAKEIVQVHASTLRHSASHGFSRYNNLVFDKHDLWLNDLYREIVIPKFSKKCTCTSCWYVIFQSYKYFYRIPYPWKYVIRHWNCRSTLCTSWAISVWRTIHNSGQHGGQTIFRLVYRVINASIIFLTYENILVDTSIAGWHRIGPTGWAIWVWRTSDNGDQHGGDNIFILVFESCKCFHCILFQWKHTSRYIDCAL